MKGLASAVAVVVAAGLGCLEAACVTGGERGKVERTETGVRLVRDGKTVWNFEIDTEDGKPYVHPLVTPSGLTLTSVRPADHVWHKGLWFSWKFINGINFWETPDKCGPGGAGRTVLKSKEVSLSGLGAKVGLVKTYCNLSGDGLLEERCTVDFNPPDEVGGYAILSEHEFTALKDVVLERTPPYQRADGAWAGGYAGLTLRLTADAAARFSVRGDGEGFVSFANPASGESILFRAYEEPKSAKFYAWPDRRMLNLSPVWSGPISLKAGEKLRLRYGVEVRSAPKARAPAASSDGLHGRVTRLERISAANARGDESQRTWRGTAWRNERVHMPFVVWSGSAHPLKARASVLTGPDGATLPLEVRWVGEVIADDRPHGAAVDPIKYPEYLVGDVLETSQPFHLTAFGYRAVWAKARTTAETPPGVYRGKLEVTDAVTSSSVGFNLELEVLQATLPKKKAFHLDIWQTPWTLSRYYRVEPFSPEHFAKMEPFLRELADAGQKAITTTITDYPWNKRENIDSARSMVRYVRMADGSYVADFTVMDRYVAFAEGCGIGPEIHCYAPVKFEGGTSYYYIDATTGEEKTLDLKPGTADYETYWGPLLTQLEAHAAEKGWTGRLYVALDEKSPAETSKTADLIAKYAPSAKLHMSGNSSPDNFTGIRIDGFSQQLGAKAMTETFLASLATRRRRGLYTTFYTCCVPFRPNAMPMNPLHEQRWLGLYVAAKGFDGYLKSTFFRWPVSTNPLEDTHCLPGLPCGDSFLVYPGPRLSLRWESLVDGIEDAEKIRILREKGRMTPELTAALSRIDMPRYGQSDETAVRADVEACLTALDKASR